MGRKRGEGESGNGVGGGLDMHKEVYGWKKAYWLNWGGVMGSQTTRGESERILQSINLNELQR